MFRYFLFLVAFFGCQTLTVYAWHDLGHEVIAAIAWEGMTPGARAAAVAMLRRAPVDAGVGMLQRESSVAAAGSGTGPGEQDRALFLRAACWADDVRTGPRRPRYHQALWHFTDFFWEQMTPDSPARQRPDVPLHGELVMRLPALAASLRDAKAPAVSPSKGTDLAWFLHLMGDIAQPLHCSGRITATEPDGDQGGNLFLLSPVPAPGGGRPANLHFFWDHVIERDYGENADIAQVAAEITAQHPRPAPADLALGQYEAWARRSQRLVIELPVYPATLARGVEPSAEYREQVKAASKAALALAGYRLGETLNQVLAAP